ncbi:MAG: PEGA domain-containing protein [Kiritimatiellae bacterium]|nr:PEGA domain-containing protein [Kiritimatiellia bacterium]
MKLSFCFTIAQILIFHSLIASGGKGPATRLDIASQPSGATIMVNHVAKGVAPLTITDLPAGPHLVQIQKAGFRDAFDTVVLESGVNRTLNFKLEPITGILLITSDPPDCEVSNKGISLGKTPLLITTLEHGLHKLTIASPGYQAKEIEVVIEGRTPIKQAVSLMSDSGTISVSSDPAGAEVLVNGISRGHAPCRIDRIPGGTVTLAVKAEGFEPHTREIALAAGEIQSLDIKLKPLPGTLRVVSIPEKGRVYINNEYRGHTPLDLVDIAPGNYRVRVDLSGHEPVAREVNLPQGSSITEEFRLTRNTGRLEIVTAPSGATILLNDKKVGITITRGMDSNAISDPFSVEDVLEGEHEVEIFRKGFANQKKPVSLKRGETVTLQFKLQRKFIPNYEVTTTRSYYKGVLEFMNEEGIRLETVPGISQTIPMKDVKKHGPLQEEE